MAVGKEEVFEVRFWGTRGSIATPGPETGLYGGNTSCVSVRYGDVDVIFDAGTGIRALGLALARERRETGRWLDLHLLLSHTHWDHIQGLPFFEPAYMEGVRLSIYGSPRKGRFLESILRGQMDEEYFPVGMSALAADVTIHELFTEHIRIGPANVEWMEQVFHPGGCVHYRLSAGERRIVYATDVELDRTFGAAPRADMPERAAAYLAFAEDADLLIGDGQYTAAEYAACAGRGHTSLPTLLDVAARCRVKRLAVFHHDPDHNDAALQALEDRHGRMGAETCPDTVFWAREGMTVRL
ncbi:MAG: MBL fold metallo-hydrolase [Lentisphaerae bacterium]|nr:MBL fold metallo-hydrolase [Lentisphaerota bacterium]